ncbi:hypothetical protein PG994_013506 [Apiospora phragmitis]|uniref:Clr5 domain-containing protein n=1 Tax=Apiospora phragmitis TaxID=2905665 RepID=A0ABR1TBD6_9PEZI
MSSALTIRCANDLKDFSIWDHHKETFRRLFLTEGMSLAAVRDKMVVDFKFPVTNVKTYEVVLREHFTFRTCKELPSYLQITPKGGIGPATTPRGSLISTGAPETALSSILVAGSTENSKIALMPPLRPLLSHSQMFPETINTDEIIIQNIVNNPITQVYGKLRKNVLSQELMRLLRHHWEGEMLSTDQKFMIAGALHSLAYMISNYRPPTSSQPSLQPRTFGMSASIAVLETACVQLTNKSNFYNDTIQRPVENWIADVADPILLQQFFRLKRPAAAAVWINLYYGSFMRNKKAFRVSMEVALGIYPDD